MYIRFFLILLSAATILFACQKNTDQAKEKTPLSLNFDEKEEAYNGWNVHFKGIEEGRCPCDANCIIAGWAKITLEVTDNTKTETVELWSDIEHNPPGDQSDTAELWGHTIKLNDLRPENCNEPQEDDYVVVIDVL